MTDIRTELKKRANELREEADNMDKLAQRPLPDKWEVGMKVRYLKDKDWAWSGGDTGTVVKLRGEYSSRKGCEYQVFYTSHERQGGTFWTTPEDVEWIE